MRKNDELTIATYNILFANEAEKIIENIVKMVEEGVNIFCLQELINIRDEEFIIDRILKKLGGNWKAAHHVGPEYSKLSIGTGVLWDSSIINLKTSENILLPKIKKFDFFEKLYYKIVGVPAIPLQRKALACYFAKGQNQFRVTCVHLDNIGGPFHRRKQLSYLVSFLKKKEIDQEIICGDFNTFDLLKTGYEKKLIHRLFDNEFIDATDKVGWTSDIYNIDFRTSVKIFPWLIKTFHIHIRRRLDYIWVKDIQILSCAKRNVSGSDHLPVVAKLQL